jgi:hypothetical protein
MLERHKFTSYELNKSLLLPTKAIGVSYLQWRVTCCIHTAASYNDEELVISKTTIAA